MGQNYPEINALYLLGIRYEGLFHKLQLDPEDTKNVHQALTLFVTVRALLA